MARLVFKVEGGQHVLFDITSDAPIGDNLFLGRIDNVYEAITGFKPPGTVEFDDSMGQWFRYYDGGVCKSFASMHDAMCESNPLHTYTPIEAA